jgi:succinoglycan biosynthesis protein ExoO
MSKVEIGVVIPTWNSAKTLTTALLSLQQQVGCQVNIVVADSNSKDGTLELCAAQRVETVYVPAGNMYRAVNEGLRRLKGEWLAYLNSDDFVYADAYARLVARGEALGADVVYGNGDYVDIYGRFLYSLTSPRPALLPGLFGGAFLGFLPHGAVFRRPVFDELRGFDEQFRHIADVDFFARALAAGKRFAFERGAPVAAFRIHREQISRKEQDVVRQELASWRKGRLVGGRWPLVLWKVRNLGQYALRWLRTGRMRGYSSI